MSRIRRILVDGQLDASTDEIVLDEAAAHYARDVLRLPSGTRVEIGDASGIVLAGTLRLSDDRGACVDSLEPLEVDEPDHEIVLAAALIKKPRWEWLVEKATELGASELIPIEAERSVQRTPSGGWTARLARWQRIADEATKQCRRARGVQVCAPRTLDEMLGQIGGFARTYVLDPSGRPARELFRGDRSRGKQHARLACFVGPEGGWSDSELERLTACGAQPLSLGPSVLRTETAAIAALTVLGLASR